MTKKNPTVSVIIPTYNRAHLLERAVRSVLNQTFTNLEVIVVDDGSTDETPQLIEQLIKKDDRIRYLRHDENKGSQASRNTGSRAARGDYVGFLDSDDEWLPYKLEKQLALFNLGRKELGVVYSGFIWEYHDGRQPTISLPRYRGYIYKNALKTWIAHTSTLLVRKDLLYKAGMWDERLQANQEWDLCIRLAHLTKFEFISEPLAIYHLNNTQRISKNIFRLANGYLDVIKFHLPEILSELGRPGLSTQLSHLGKFFIGEKNINPAKACFYRAWLVWPFNLFHFTNFIICSLGLPVYLKFYSFLKTLINRFLTL